MEKQEDAQPQAHAIAFNYENGRLRVTADVDIVGLTVLQNALTYYQKFFNLLD